jgi:formate hydrogenlyase subunit 3/multisubunit Na+/H+ antiporter MnhD subunit
MNELYYIIVLPILAGILLFLVPERVKWIKGTFALIISAITLFFAIRLFRQPGGIVTLDLFSSWFREGSLCHRVLLGVSSFSTYHIDNLSKFITLAISVFSVLVSLYALRYVTRKREIRNYYPYFLLTAGLSAATALTDNLLFFLFFWGILGLTLYKLIRGYDEESSDAAKKTLIMIGSSDGIMMLGIGIIWKITGTLSISGLTIPTTSPLMVTAFLSLLVGSFTKAGAFPLHTWLPDYAKSAPASSTAYLPASLDKLLGIYFLYRICVDMFVLNQGLVFLLLLIGVMTIIFGVMMALVQHNYKRLLGYHAVSQVGYMILGLGLGSPLGIAGGLFHMINNAVYKGGLFLSAGNVEHVTGKEDLSDVGGLSRAMPVTFVATLIFALSISGVPPFNGFASKWLIYQGIIDFGHGAGWPNQLWWIWLGLAVLGSALTLASFIKYTSGIFLGRKKDSNEQAREVNPLMWISPAILALVCVIFGVFASSWVVPGMVMPLHGTFEYAGVWQSTTVSILVLVSILLGVILYLVGNIKKFRTEDSFIGGETFREEMQYPVTEFYKTIGEFKFFSVVYHQAEKKWFDIYDIGRGIVLSIGRWLSRAHTGILTSYAIWIFAGLVILILLLFNT